MDANHLELVTAELKSARERLRAAAWLADQGLVPDAISRAYYAVFHAAKAALLSRGIRAESHSGLKALFGLKLVDTNVIDRRFGRILAELMDRRESSDYDVWNALDADDALRSVSEAREFVTAVEGLLERDTRG